MPACHAGGRGFESRPDRETNEASIGGFFYFMAYYVYIIESISDGTFYKGYTTDYLKRLAEHNAGESQYTSRKTPWRLVYVEEMPTKTAALVREKQLKRSNKQYLVWLIGQPCNFIK
jgi:putative endonuclease